MERRGGAATADVPRLAQLGLTALAVTSAAAVYKAAGDVSSLAFVVGSYGALVLLFHCLRDYERAHPGAEGRSRREVLRRRIWALCTLLTAMFACKFARIVPWPLTVVVWAVAADAALGGFWAFFLN